jgi:hypothetical protein
LIYSCQTQWQSPAQTESRSPKTRGSATAAVDDNPISQEIRDVVNPTKLRPQFRRQCELAKKRIEAITAEEENNRVIDAVHDRRWGDVPDGKKHVVTDYLNAEIEDEQFCGALALDSGQKRIGLFDLNNLTDSIALRDAWNDWVGQKERLAASPWSTPEEAQRDCEQAQQGLSRLAIQSDPLHFNSPI